jgi:fatty-acyl-CoA synthase
MLGYLKDPEGTSKVVADGWSRPGDLGVIGVDGYLELRHRVRTSSSREGRASPQWRSKRRWPLTLGSPGMRWGRCARREVGELPLAFVTLLAGSSATTEEIIE